MFKAKFWRSTGQQTYLNANCKFSWLTITGQQTYLNSFTRITSSAGVRWSRKGSLAVKTQFEMFHEELAVQPAFWERYPEVISTNKNVNRLTKYLQQVIFACWYDVLHTTRINGWSAARVRYSRADTNSSSILPSHFQVMRGELFSNKRRSVLLCFVVFVSVPVGFQARLFWNTWWFLNLTSSAIDWRRQDPRLYRYRIEPTFWKWPATHARIGTCFHSTIFFCTLAFRTQFCFACSC